MIGRRGSGRRQRTLRLVWNQPASLVVRVFVVIIIVNVVVWGRSRKAEVIISAGLLAPLAVAQLPLVPARVKPNELPNGNPRKETMGDAVVIRIPREMSFITGIAQGNRVCHSAVR